MRAGCRVIRAVELIGGEGYFVYKSDPAPGAETVVVKVRGCRTASGSGWRRKRKSGHVCEGGFRWWGMLEGVARYPVGVEELAGVPPLFVIPISVVDGLKCGCYVDGLRQPWAPVSLTRGGGLPLWTTTSRHCDMKWLCSASRRAILRTRGAAQSNPGVKSCCPL
jgi:hypothetical protein